MNLPAIKASIGNWKYYITSLSFRAIDEHVKGIDDEIHNSNVLSEMLQRSITRNYRHIKKYLLTQDERFFNSLVLAIYDGDPKWVEFDISFEGEDYLNVGFLKLIGGEKIFPVDGQHRVMGIKAALKEKPELSEETVPVIFIGHKNSPEGKQRSRRLFSTLNRYAKPVSEKDKIALDEDDIVAIITRNMLETFEPFSGRNIVIVAGKAIPDQNKSAFTSIVTLYQCNLELLKFFLVMSGNNSRAEDFIRFRPYNSIILEFEEFCFSYWTSFVNEVSTVAKYLSSDSDNPASAYRNKENGGNLLFRPIGLLPFVYASLEISKRKDLSFIESLKMLNKVNLDLNSELWEQILWNDVSKKMLRADNTLVKLLLIYQIDRDLITEDEHKRLIVGFCAKKGISITKFDEVMKGIV